MLRRILQDFREENSIKRNRVLRDPSNPLENYDDIQLYSKYRFDRLGIMEIVKMLEKDLSFSDNRNHPYSPTVQVMATLRYLASNSFQDVVAETLVATQPSVSRIVNRVCRAIAKRAKDFIRFPTTENEIRNYRLKFAELANFPQVVGCIDCTHIKVIPPKESAQAYYGRKPYPTINVQAVCGPNGEFTNIVVKWPGSVHDSRIFRESGLYRKLEAGEYSGLLLGDSGYGCSTFLLPPYRMAENMPRYQERFNKAHSRTRVSVEQLFGRWKRRFSILHGEVRLKMENVFPLVTACAVLQNIAIQRKLPDVTVDDYEEETENGDDLHYHRMQLAMNGNNIEDGKSLRDHIARTFFD